MKPLRIFLAAFLSLATGALGAGGSVPSLTPLTAPASADLLYIIDVSDTTDGAAGTGKKITLADVAALMGGAPAFTSITGLPVTLAGYGITDAQGLDSDLTAIAALTTATFGRSLLAETTAITTRSALGLVPSSAGRVLYVSKSTTATDTRTGLSAYDPAVPFATLAGAKTAAASGDTIMVSPGTWNEKNLLKNGVNWIFEPGSAVLYTGAATGGIFDDTAATGTGGAVVCSIVGDSFATLSTGTTTGLEDVSSVLSITHAGSFITLRARRCGTAANSTADSNTVVLNQTNGTVLATIDEILGGDNVTLVYWWVAGGRMEIDFKDMLLTDTQGYSAVVTAIDATATGELYLRGNKISATAGKAFDFQDTDSSCRVWAVGISDISGAFGTITAQAAGAAAPKYYFIGCGKLYATAAASSVFNLTQGVYWMDFQKLTIPAGATSGLTTATGTIKVDFDEPEIAATRTP